MRTTLKTGIGVMAIAALTTAPLLADVRSQEKMRMQFGGALGRMAIMFGGKTVKEGITSEVAVKGDRKLTRMDQRGQLIDLAEEKVYEIDYADKSYKIATFAEIRKRMEEAQQRAKEHMARAQGNKPASQPQKKMAIDVVSKETGEKKAVNGFDCRQVITTVTMHEEGKTLEAGGGMVVTTDAWLTAPIAAMKDAGQFDRRYFEKVSGMDAAAAAQQQMAAAMAMFPGLAEAMTRARVEGAKLEGTAIMTTMTVDAVKSPEQMAKDSEQPQDSGGGLGGLLARKMTKKKEPAEGSAGPANRANVMTSTHEVLSVATDVPADAVAIPAGFKQK